MGYDSFPHSPSKLLVLLHVRCYFWCYEYRNEHTDIGLLTLKIKRSDNKLINTMGSEIDKCHEENEVVSLNPESW